MIFLPIILFRLLRFSPIIGWWISWMPNVGSRNVEIGKVWKYWKYFDMTFAMIDCIDDVIIETWDRVSELTWIHLIWFGLTGSLFKTLYQPVSMPLSLLFNVGREWYQRDGSLQWHPQGTNGKRFDALLHSRVGSSSSHHELRNDPVESVAAGSYNHSSTRIPREQEQERAPRLSGSDAAASFSQGKPALRPQPAHVQFKGTSRFQRGREREHVLHDAQPGHGSRDLSRLESHNHYQRYSCQHYQDIHRWRMEHQLLS